MKSRANRGVRRGDLLVLQSNAGITKGACPWDIYSLRVADEMFGR